MKKNGIGAKETHPVILRGGHTIKSGGTVFCRYQLGWIVYHGAVT